MAYEGGGLGALWRPDLTTRAGAISAVNSAKFGFLIVGTFRLITNALPLFAAITTAPDLFFRDVVFAIIALNCILPFFTAWRLHLLKGAYITPITTFLYVIGILATLNIFAMVIGLIFTAVFVSGCRGAWALHRGTGFDDEVYDTFG